MRTSGSLLWGELFPFSTEFARCSGAVGPVEVCFFMVLRTLQWCHAPGSEFRAGSSQINSSSSIRFDK